MLGSINLFDNHIIRFALGKQIKHEINIDTQLIYIKNNILFLRVRAISFSSHRFRHKHGGRKAER